MSPRIIQLPLSGRDRRHYVRELRLAEQQYEILTKKAAAAHHAADLQLRLAHRYNCEAWSALQFIGGDAEPSPTIAQALHGGCELLEVQCRRCNHTDLVDLALVIWPRDRQVHTLKRALFCRPCDRTYGTKLRPDLVGLRMREPPAPEPRRALRPAR